MPLTASLLIEILCSNFQLMDLYANYMTWIMPGFGNYIALCLILAFAGIFFYMKTHGYSPFEWNCNSLYPYIQRNHSQR